MMKSKMLGGARVLLLFAGMCVACDGASSPERADPYAAPPDRPLPASEIPSFEEFEARTRVNQGGRQYYLVEWDYPIASKEELWRYYTERFYGGSTEKSAVKTTPEAGVDTLQCNSETPSVTCVDDVYANYGQLGLRYCVSDAFGPDKATIVAAMAVAAESWARVANTSFRYIDTNDADCEQTDAVPAGVDFKVSPWTGGGACSFWPRSGRACVSNTLVYDTLANFFPNTMEGVMRHELGHILGFHHEHMRADAATASCEAFEMRYLTDWDPNSIMGYPAVWGGCSIGGGSEITVDDGVGARQLYGAPARWLPAYDPSFL